MHGQLDYRLDVSEGFQIFTTLQRLKVPSQMLYFPDEGHWVQKPQNARIWYKTVNDWVDQWLIAQFSELTSSVSRDMQESQPDHPGDVAGSAFNLPFRFALP